jgi:hypothetical protein
MIKKTQEQIRKEKNQELLERFKNGESLNLIPNSETWFPKRGIIKKDKEGMEKLYKGKESKDETK